MMCNYVMVDFSFLKRLNEETVARLAFTLQVHTKKKEQHHRHVTIQFKFNTEKPIGLHFRCGIQVQRLHINEINSTATSILGYLLTHKASFTQ